MRFGPVTALDRLTLTLGKGKLIGLLGPSGCGKSTTLFLLAGLYQPTEGRIFFGDRDMTRVPPERRHVGLVFQNYALYPHMTVFENIAFPLRMKRLPLREIRDRVQRMAELVRIEGLLERKPAQLSGGQQQRVAIARALVKEPELLLLDEPLSNLDARLRLEMREEIRRIQRDVGVTTVFVTHDQEEALSLADEVVILEGGKLQQVGTPEDVYRRPANRFVAYFLGNPPMNFLEGIYEEGRVKAAGFHFPLPLDLPSGTRLTLGIRPEDVEVVGFGRDSTGDGMGMGRVVDRQVFGRQHLLKVKVGEKELRAWSFGEGSPPVGYPVALRVDPGKVHIFVGEEGQACFPLQGQPPAVATLR